MGDRRQFLNRRWSIAFNPLACVWFLVAMLLCGCSSSDPTVVLVGDWAGDMSATGNAIRAMRLKNENPDASSSQITQGARALGAIAISFAEDKTFELVWQDTTKTGTWSVDNEHSEVLLTLNPEPVAPPADDPAADKAEPAASESTQWVARLDVSAQELELFMFDQATLDYAKKINETAKEKDKVKLKGLRLTIQ